MTDTLDGLALKGITKRYKKFTLSRISGQILSGHITALVGKNGAGKTTLLKTAFGLVRPDSGSVGLNGKSIVNTPPSNDFQSRFLLGYLPEEQVFYDWMTVSRLLAFCASLHPGWQPGRAAQLLTDFELDPDKKVGDLSKGMRVKLGLITALAHAPQALLLDEPLTGLDPVSRKTTIECIRALVTDLGCPCLVSSHDLEDIRKISDEIWVLRDGSISLQASHTPDDAWYTNETRIDNLYDLVCDSM